MSTIQQELLEAFDRRSFLRRLSLSDCAWAVVLLGLAAWVLLRYGEAMSGYERGILIGTALSFCLLGWHWRSTRLFLLVAAALSLLAIRLYGTDLAAAESIFALKYLLASQSAIMWMSALFVLATVTYFFALLSGSAFSLKVGAALTWSATCMGLVGLMVRWRESYLIDVDVGYIPVSNLYEVFILFCITTALIYLYYEQRSKAYHMGGFVLLIISAAVAFLLWYTFDRGAHEILPLVPALQSYWMKIHVPANFVGYGAFALAAMVAVVYLLRQKFNHSDSVILNRLPTLEQLDDVMYRSIALGFSFFTIATVLGAVWAAEAWGSYWQWDPKETWALIVWLNYAGWLHFRLTQGIRGTSMAVWAIVGLLVTLFAFLGVNMFLSGLHSYGEL